MGEEDVRARLAAIEETYRRADLAGVCVVDGFGCKVVVERGGLEVSDGIGEQRRVRRYEKATHGLSRVVVLNAAGIVSFEAVRWCTALSIGLLVLDSKGAVQLSSHPRRRDDARLRRAQGMAAFEPYGVDLSRELLAVKLLGQARNLVGYLSNEEASSEILGLVEALGGITSGSREAIEELRSIEATAASLYFSAWVGRGETLPHFASSERRRVPSHWQRFDGRRSVLSSANGNRGAERPINAILNYLYGLLEIEAILACEVVGLDPGLGIVHADQRGRDSFALDLMEPVRPEVDAYVLELVSTRSFRKADFVETREGGCRLAAPLTHELAESLPHWSRLVGPYAEKAAHLIGSVIEGKYDPVTPLTRSRTKGAAAAVRARKSLARDLAGRSAPRQRPVTSKGRPAWRCPSCGGPVENQRHVRCEACIAADPRQSPEVRGRRGAAISSRKRALREAEVAGLPLGCDEAWYREVVLPRLAGVKLAAIMEAASCSKSYASELRRGRFNPHVSTWRALALLVGVEIDTPATYISSRGEDQ